MKILIGNMHRLCSVAVVCALLLVAVAAVPRTALAYDSDATLENDGFLCTRQVARSERRYGIPLRLLGAIAATESGLRHQKLGVRVPWPWTINAEGVPYRFHTKSEAVAKVRELQARGIKSIDVGCMQVNLMHHPDAFGSLNQAFEPVTNVDYAARFLRGHYDDTGSWREAVGRYHSRTAQYANKYTALVYNQWYGLADSVARSRGQDYAALDTDMRVEGRHFNQRPAKSYRSYIRTENGEQKEVNLKATPAPSANNATVRSINPGTTKQGSKGKFDLTLIKPTYAAGVVASAPAVDMQEGTSPLVLNLTPERPTAKAASGHNASGKEVTDSRILKFVD